MKFHHIMAISLFAVSLTACNNSTQNTAQNNDSAATESIQQKPLKPVLGSYGIATENMDLSVKPGDNFFKYVNGTWLEKTEIPADKDNYGGFAILADLSQERVRKIIEQASAKKAPLGSEEQKIGDLYAAFMDTDAIEAAGLTPITGDIELIRNVKSHEDVAVLMANPSLGLRSPIAPFVSVDLKDVQNYVVYLTQSGLGMPNRSYYLDEGEKADSIRAAYIDYLTAMLLSLIHI